MTRTEIIDQFRQENPEITARVITNTVLNSWLLFGDKDFCAKTRCIVDQDGTTIETEEDDTYYDLTSEIDKFFDIDIWPGSGVLYNGIKIKKKTMAELDMEARSWRDRASGTPKAWYRRGKYLYLDRPIDSNEYDITVYAVLISDDWNTNVAPYNQLQHLENFHYGMVLWLQWKAKAKVGKREDALKAMAEYMDYIKWAKNELGGNKYGRIFFRPRV